MQEVGFNSVKDQMGPCGTACGTCALGNGKIAETSKKTLEYANMYAIKEWAHHAPEGEGLDWGGFEKTIGWMAKYAFCFGCEKGGGPPDCDMRTCANQKGFQLCSQCDELEGCNKFDWIGDYAATMKENLAENKGKAKEELIVKALSEVED